MAKYSSTLEYRITTPIDKSGFVQAQNELRRLQQALESLNNIPIGVNTQQIQQAVRDAQLLQEAMHNAFNFSTGQLNTRHLTRELQQSGRELREIYASFSGISRQIPQANTALAAMHSEIFKINTSLKQSNALGARLFNTFSNTVRWGITASVFQEMTNSLYNAVNYMGELDKSLTNIRLVTSESKDSMREFARYANEAAKSLGASTVGYTDAALIYAQQGYGLSDQKKLAEYTIKTANSTGQDTSEVSEQMTALINGYQLSVDEVGSALDTLAKVANTSAADLEELATATSKVASTAKTLGVSQEELTAQIATVVSVTREAPETIGNS